ncbi:MAG TPA: DUF929 family protein [Acidimicrobiales bacterium]|jgi:hypothetical protein
MPNTQKGRPRAASDARTRRQPAPPPPNFFKRHPWVAKLSPIALVVVVLVTLIAVKVTNSPAAGLSSTTSTSGQQAGSGDDGTTALPAGVLSEVTSVSASTLASVGQPSGLALPSKVAGSPSLLTGSDGKPEILYIGAEYCPFCAAERWAMVEALSRFGSFTGLAATHSSDTDEYPGTQTFSFYGSTYSSPYLDFVPVEEETNQPSGDGYTVLQAPTASEQATLTKYDTSPYTDDPGSIPFIDVGDHYLQIGASYNPQILQGLSMQQIAAQLDHPSSAVAQAIDGTANEITAAICTVTGNQPASVCDTPTINAIVHNLEQ